MKKNIFNLLFLIILFPLFTFAQGAANGTTPPPAPSNSSTASPIPTSTPQTPTSSGVTPVALPPRSIPKTQPKAVAPLSPASSSPVINSNNPDIPANPPTPSFAGVILGLLAVGLGTALFFGLNAKKKDDKQNNKCANIKKLMEDKLNDLSDLKSQLADLAKDKTIEQIKEMGAGTSEGKLLVFIENREKEYEKLKDLYEKCISDLDLEKVNYTGVIIEESLSDKKVLSEVKILNKEVELVTEKHKTPWVKQWVKHTVEVKEEDAEKIAKQLSRDLEKEHPWYADFKNENYHFIIYRGKVFKVDLKNPKLYKDARAYGISLGIPEYQVNLL